MYKVLFADDVALNILVAQKMLHSLPIESRKASNGQQCLELIREEQPDLLLLDLLMPIVDGFEVLQAVRSGEAGDPRMPIIVLSALNAPDDAKKALEMGADDFVTKPINMDKLIRAVRKILHADQPDNSADSAAGQA